MRGVVGSQGSKQWQPYAVLTGTFPESTRMTSVHPIDSRTFCSSNRAELIHTEHPSRELREGPLPHWLQCTLKIGGLAEEEGNAFISQLSTLPDQNSDPKFFCAHVF